MKYLIFLQVIRVFIFVNAVPWQTRKYIRDSSMTKDWTALFCNILIIFVGDKTVHRY